MSTLQVSTAQITTLSDGTNTTSCTNAIRGSAKAWVNFNGLTSPATIRTSYNVSSVTKSATGTYTINFTNNLPDANYVMLGTAEPSNVPSVGATFYTIIGSNNSNAFTKTTSSAQICTAYVTSLAGASTLWDSQTTYVAFFD